MTLQDRETSAKNALRYGHFKKAIVHLKLLLDTEKRAEWVDWAQTAHTSLAQQLFHEKKFQEVVKLFASGYRLFNLSLETPIYIDALLNVNRLDDALDHYLQLSKQVPQKKNDKSALSLIRSGLAARAIAGESKIIDCLPADDPVVVDFDKAYQLLDAYCSSDDEAVAHSLKLISFRSPYRDLRQIVAAAIQLDKNSGDNLENSRDSLAHIAADSAFIKLAELLHLVSKDTRDILTSFSSLNSDAQRFIQQMKGWQEGQDKLINKLANLPDEPDPTKLFRIADECKKIQPEYCSNIAKMALIHARAGKNKVVTSRRYEQRFNKLSPLESIHVEALYEKLAFELKLKHEYYFEPDEQFEDLEYAWEEYLRLLDEGETNQDVLLIKALVYRYFIEERSKGDTVCQTTAHYLKESLVFDPTDKESHIKLIRYYFDNNKLKEARDNLNLALKHYPDDLQILLLAVEIAIASSAYKKATNYAKAILEVDPINRQARALLCNAHLSHSRKQAKINKWHLFEKELDEAERWGGDQVPIQVAIAVLRASMAIAQKQNKQANEYLQQLRTLVTTDLNASLIIHLEAASINADAKRLHQLAKLKWKPAKKQTKDVLFSLFDFSETHLDNYHEDVVYNAINALSPALQFIEVKGFTLQDYERVLTFWHRIQQIELLNIYIDKAVREHGKTPMTTYYLYANKQYLSFDEYEDVGDAIDQAKDQGDTTIAARLITVLKKCGPPLFSDNTMGNPFFDFDEDDDNEFDENLPAGELDKKALSILPELIRTAASNDEVILMMQDIMSVSHLDVMKFRDTVGSQGLKEMLIAFIVDKTEPEDFIANYNSAEKGKKKQLQNKTKNKPKKKNSQQINLFGDND